MSASKILSKFYYDVTGKVLVLCVVCLFSDHGHLPPILVELNDLAKHIRY